MKVAHLPTEVVSLVFLSVFQQQQQNEVYFQLQLSKSTLPKLYHAWNWIELNESIELNYSVKSERELLCILYDFISKEYRNERHRDLLQKVPSTKKVKKKMTGTYATSPTAAITLTTSCIIPGFSIRIHWANNVRPWTFFSIIFNPNYFKRSSPKMMVILAL